MPTSQDKICGIEEVPNGTSSVFVQLLSEGLLLRHWVVVKATEERVVNYTLDVACDEAMAGRRRQQHGRDLIIEELIRLFIDRLALGRIGLSHTAVEDLTELFLQLIRHLLAGSIGTDHVGLVPVVRVMDVFRPTTGEVRSFRGTQGAQERRPRQTYCLHREQLIDRSKVGSQNFRNDLAGGVALVVERLETETIRPDIAFRIITSGDTVFVHIGKLEFGGCLVGIV